LKPYEQKLLGRLYFALYILYLDESGNQNNPADRHFVLGGAAVFEQSTFFLNRDLNDIQQKHFPSRPPVDFHASKIRAGSGFWRSVPESKRDEVLLDVGLAIKQPAARTPVVLFAAVVEKSAQLYGEDAVKCAAEQVIKRFDTFLTRRFKINNDPQRGLLVFAESQYQQRAALWVHGFRSLGTQWGALNNLADMPYFAAARENRLLQAADYVAHAVFLLYERRDPSLIRTIISKFDQKDGVIHGLYHVATPQSIICECPSHASRHAAGTIGTWL
jgi:hypothetical protein